MEKSLTDKLRFDEMYDLSITDSRKALYKLGYHAKNAFNTIGKFLRNTTLLATAALSIGLAGCKTPFTPDEPPIAETYSVSPNSGPVPLPAQIVYGGRDPEGKPLEYSAYVDLDGDKKEGPGEGIIPPQPNPINEQYTFTTPGNFNVYGKMVDPAGNEVQTRLGEVNPTNPIEPPVEDLLDVSVLVRQNKTEQPHRAKVKVFNSADESTPLALLQTDSNGNLDYHSSKKISELSGVTLTAVLVDANGNPMSYEHTLRYPAGDLSVVLKPHPAPAFASMEDYARNYRMNDMAYDPSHPDGFELWQTKWDLEGEVAPENALKGVGIFTTSPLDGSSFSALKRQILDGKIRDSNDIEVLVRGSNLPDTDGDGFPDLDNFILQGEPIAGTHYTISNGIIIPEPGYILVTPDGALPTGMTEDTRVSYYQGSPASGIITRALIRIRPTLTEDVFRRSVSHGFKHGITSPHDLIKPYNSQTLAPALTILRYDTPNTTLGQGLADIEDPYIANEKLYKFAASSSDFLKVPQPGSWN